MTINHLHPDTELELTGPDGTNPLGFLCALGTLRTLSYVLPQANVKMAWRQISTRWIPVLKLPQEYSDIGCLTEILWNKLKNTDMYVSENWDDTHNISKDNYRKYSQKTYIQLNDASCYFIAEWVTTIACESLVDSKGFVVDTAFRTMSGQGHQHFLKQMRALRSSVEMKHIYEALLGWKYQDEKLNLRFDPTENRNHATRWKDPSKDGLKTVWGANLLAVQGLPLHSVFIADKTLQTTGFRGQRASEMFWRWPLWTGFLNLDCVRSVIPHALIQSDAIDRHKLSMIGIEEIFQTQRIAAGKFRAFTDAQPL